MILRAFIALCVFALTALLLAGAAGLYVMQRMDAPGPLASAKTLVIPRGTSALGIAALLEKEGVIENRHFFRLRYVMDKRPELKAGEYEFPPGITLKDALAQIAAGKVVLRQITIPEGLTAAEIVTLLQNDPALSSTVAGVPPEGSLMPESYRYSLGDDPNLLLARMKKAMTEAIAAAWARRDASLADVIASPEQMVTLASIVEKETGIAAERPRVAGVFINRLKKKMPLQSDPTVIYGITEGKAALGRGLTYADLEKPSAYNTYTIPALPPGPIANPGMASLLAVMQPEKHDFLYFVADGTGGHRFAATMDEHLKNVAWWRGVQKKEK